MAAGCGLDQDPEPQAGPWLEGLRWGLEGEPWQSGPGCSAPPGWGAVPLPGRLLSAPQDTSLLAQEVVTLLGEGTTVTGKQG